MADVIKMLEQDHREAEALFAKSRRPMARRAQVL